MKSSAPALELGTESEGEKVMRAITLACRKSPGHDLELGGASNKPEPVVERIANRLQLERALRALRAEGLHADHMN
jgi:hypothetical protein